MDADWLRQQLNRLLALQEVDSELKCLRRRYDELMQTGKPEQLKAELESATDQLKQWQEELADQKKQAKYWEQEANSMREDSTGLERKMYGGEVSSVKELEQSEKKVASLRKKAGELEDKVLGAIEDIEEYDRKVEHKQQTISELADKLNQQQADYEGELKQTGEQIAAAERKRDEKAAGVDKGMMEKYVHLCKRKAGVAIVAMKERTCTGCRVTLPVILANRVRRCEDALPCENCGRLLCYVEA